MFRITILDNGRTATFKLEGKLTQECIAEVEKAWAAFSNTPRQQPIAVDLSGVSFVGERGQETLARMHAAGAKLIATGPMMRALIEEIAAGDRKGPSGGWIRSALSLLFVLLLACGAKRTAKGGAHPPGTSAVITFPAEACIVAVNQWVPSSSSSSARHAITLVEGALR